MASQQPSLQPRLQLLDLPDELLTPISQALSDGTYGCKNRSKLRATSRHMRRVVRPCSRLLLGLNSTEPDAVGDSPEVTDHLARLAAQWPEVTHLALVQHKAPWPAAPAAGGEEAGDAARASEWLLQVQERAVSVDGDEVVQRYAAALAHWGQLRSAHVFEAEFPIVRTLATSCKELASVKLQCRGPDKGPPSTGDPDKDLQHQALALHAVLTPLRRCLHALSLAGSLTSLHLSVTELTTDAVCWRLLDRLTSLQHLQLWWTRFVSTKWQQEVTVHEQLLRSTFEPASLDLPPDLPVPSILASARQRSSNSTMELDDNQAEAAALQQAWKHELDLSQLTKLRSFQGYVDHCVRGLHACTQLTHLHMDHKHYNPQCLSQLSLLERLSLGDGHLTDDMARVLASFPRLTQLCVASVGLTRWLPEHAADEAGTSAAAGEWPPVVLPALQQLRVTRYLACNTSLAVVMPQLVDLELDVPYSCSILFGQGHPYDVVGGNIAVDPDVANHFAGTGLVDPQFALWRCLAGHSSLIKLTVPLLALLEPTAEPQHLATIPTLKHLVVRPAQQDCYARLSPGVGASVQLEQVVFVELILPGVSMHSDESGLQNWQTLNVEILSRLLDRTVAALPAVIVLKVTNLAEFRLDGSDASRIPWALELARAVTRLPCLAGLEVDAAALVPQAPYIEAWRAARRRAEAVSADLATQPGRGGGAGVEAVAEAAQKAHGGAEVSGGEAAEQARGGRGVEAVAEAAQKACGGGGAEVSGGEAAEHEGRPLGATYPGTTEGRENDMAAPGCGANVSTAEVAAVAGGPAAAVLQSDLAKFLRTLARSDSLHGVWLQDMSAERADDRTLGEWRMAVDQEVCNVFDVAGDELGFDVFYAQLLPARLTRG